MSFLSNKMLEKCYLLKMWHVTEITKKNFSPNQKAFSFTFFFFFFFETSFSFTFLKTLINFLIKSKTICCSIKVFLQYRKQEPNENIFNFQLEHTKILISSIFQAF